ncbi:hypothetical protein [Pseudonocardia adelaidensis]|uniref:Uncharacterized protein n=1 Tax=Pseudonocardia adelaidensis TaxID=648754 RepID=A0ABP9NCU1_9PSEU
MSILGTRVVRTEDSKLLTSLDVVRYVGEPVAAVVTDERYQGQVAAELVVVDHDPLRAVIDRLAAEGTHPPDEPGAGAAYREHLVRVLVRRALEEAAQRETAQRETAQREGTA